jgi:TRAP-type C4-dicarboxylate transport system permease small subunit
VLLLATVRRYFDGLLEWMVIALVLGETSVVIAGFVFRYLGRSLTWYDEVASVGLAWLTYYGAALAAHRGTHIGFPGILNALPPGPRIVLTIVAEVCLFGFFGVLAWTGFEVVRIVEGDTLISLPWVPLQLIHSVIPVGAILFMIAEALRLPEVLKAAAGSGFVEREVAELRDEVETRGDLRASDDKARVSRAAGQEART